MSHNDVWCHDNNVLLYSCINESTGNARFISRKVQKQYFVENVIFVDIDSFVNISTKMSTATIPCIIEYWTPVGVSISTKLSISREMSISSFLSIFSAL